jgi:transposase-like protein
LVKHRSDTNHKKGEKMRHGLTDEQKIKAREMIKEGSTRREIADRLGVDVTKIHNFWANSQKSKTPVPQGKKEKPGRIKIQKLEIKEEKEEPKVKAKSEKTMVIITSDISMLKKLIGEL